MQNEIRERLIDIFDDWGIDQYLPFHTEREMLADFLIANGVTFKDVPDTNVGEWISVDERLPEEDGRYLVYDLGQHRGVSSEEIRITHFKKGDKYHDYMWKNHFTHWMPLPTPPTEKENKHD